jgi:hypothetical protein
MVAWSRSLHATADLFLVLKRGHGDPGRGSSTVVWTTAAQQNNNVANAPGALKCCRARPVYVPAIQPARV